MLTVDNRDETRRLLDDLRGDPATRLLPVAGEGGVRYLLPIPDPTEGRAGSRSQLVMARARAVHGEALVPPSELDVAFLPDGLLSTELDVDRARPLGVRPFTVDNVLDRLNGIRESETDPDALVRFLWRLLTRERASAYGTRRSAETARLFDPSPWFWCRPGRASEDEGARLRQQRERYLAEIPLPARNGTWRPASSLAFGADWAQWVEAETPGSSAALERGAAYRALEAVSPGPHALLAPPTTVLALLDDQWLDSAEVNSSDDVSPEGESAALDATAMNVERLGFLLRLGVWEVVPLEAFDSRSTANRDRFPWAGPAVERQQSIATDAGAWSFGLNGWGGQRHDNVYLSEDYRFAWPLRDAGKRDAVALAESLRRGAGLYAERPTAVVFCPGCRDSGSYHNTMRTTSRDSGIPSIASIELHSEPWVACTVDGAALEEPVAPAEAWWHQRPPSGAGIRQSPWRLLPLCGPSAGISDELRRLSRVNSLDDAGLTTVRDLLGRLRTGLEDRSLPVDPGGSGSARQAFVGLHRLAYERLAELGGQNGQATTSSALGEVGVLCEVGEGLVYHPPFEARHDDGKFATYVRHFAAAVPLVALRRDQATLATRLGVPPLVVTLIRHGKDEGDDVTNDLRSMLAHRVPELLAILVNHSLGSQTLELSSPQFEERARRLQALTVRQTTDLVIRASLDDGAQEVVLGEGSDQDIFLERPTSGTPVLFHDLKGDGWPDRLRRKLAPHLAAVLENPAYSHTFALFLQAESDGEREEFLLELGISTDDVEAVASRVGAVGVEERSRHRRWYSALLHALGSLTASIENLDKDELIHALVEAGLPTAVAASLVEAGGGQEVRRDVGEGSPLRVLSQAGVGLADIDAALRAEGDLGLDIRVARQQFARWLDSNGRRLAATLATETPPEVAKASVRALRAPDPLAFSVEPADVDVLAPVTALLHSVGLDVDSESLVHDPARELARLSGVESVGALDLLVRPLYDEEERHRLLRQRASQWRREIKILAILSRMGPTATRTTIKDVADGVDEILPNDLGTPEMLADFLDELFVGHASLAEPLARQLDGSLTSPAPERAKLLDEAARHGIIVERLSLIERALDAPRRHHAREIKRRSERLSTSGLVPAPPPGMTAPPPRSLMRPGAPGPKKVTKVKIEAGHDRRKRELGDEGEEWALASVVGALLELDPENRATAIDQMSALLSERCNGEPVDAALSHAALARSGDLVARVVN